MAVAVDFRIFTPQNSREDLVRKIEQAPVEHAQAVLAAYELLENLHDKGILAILNGALTGGEAIIDHVVGLISSKEAVTALRVGLMLTNLLKTIDADKLAAVLANSSKEPPSLLGIGKMATSPDARRAMATGLELLTVFGAALNNAKPEKHG
jgi:uncharacterized protein YjgD (DUF1641 family)